MKNLFCNLKIWALAVSACCALAASADISVWVYYDEDNSVLLNNGIDPNNHIHVFADKDDNVGLDGAWPGKTLTRTITTTDGKTWYHTTINTNESSCYLIFNNPYFWNNGNSYSWQSTSYNNSNAIQAPRVEAKQGENYYYYTGARYALNLTGMKENDYYVVFETPHWWQEDNIDWNPWLTVDAKWDTSNAPWYKMELIGGKNREQPSQSQYRYVYGLALDPVPTTKIDFIQKWNNGGRNQDWEVTSSTNAKLTNHGYYQFGAASQTEETNNGTLQCDNFYVGIIFPTFKTCTLAELENNPDRNVVYTISDELTVANRIAGIVYAKDDNGAAAQAAGSGEIDYNDVVFNYGNTDHSNWIALTGTDATSVEEGVKLSGVQGVLTDVNNFTLAVADATVSGTSSYAKNNYTPCNFTGTQTGNNGKTYFFAKPQVMEFARINYAVYKGNGTFEIPTSSTGIVNGANLAGSFTADLNGNGSSFTQGHTYNFDGIIKTAAGESGAPRRLVGNGGYTVMVTGGIEEPNIVTGVTHVTAATQVAGVKYVDMAGRVSDRPFTGLNVVVTTMTDGSVHTVKVMK